MSGIINNKSRVFDVILTTEGKRQVAEGSLRASYYSFTDSSTIYNRDTIESGSLTETHRFVLEAANSPYDQITFESSDAGLLTGFPISGSEKYSFINGRVYSGSQENNSSPVTGSQFSTVVGGLLSSSIDAFKNQLILKSPEIIDDRPINFVISNGNVEFTITSDTIGKNKVGTARVDHIESFFQDKRLSHIPNFQFLPPVNKPSTGEIVGTPIGNYINVQQQRIETLKELKDELKTYGTDYEKSISFLETSQENNMIGQMFEIANGEVRKLDVIDFGNFEDSGEHVFFVGKVFIDDLETQTFVHMFTLIFSGSNNVH